ncbi:hypothetical protein, partial [Blastomonas sp.]|uniref:hypothetical protein n=1 Tax=Blastomonas sp. TaxID=1909299 RepID=UPI0035935541
MLNLALASAAALLNPAPANPVALPVTTHFHSVDTVAFDRRRGDRRDGRGYQGRYWRGDDGRYRCTRSNGTTGLLVGAGVGALIGDQIARRGDKTLGA